MLFAATAKRIILGFEPLRKLFYEAQYRRVFGRKLDLRNPRSFNEKIHWRMHLQRDPLHRLCCDKLRVRVYVRERTACQLIPLLGVYDTAQDIDFDKLPNEFVLKTNHGSGNTIVVMDKGLEKLDALRSRVNAALREDFGLIFLETQYLGVEKKLIVEERLSSNDGSAVQELSFHCFHGEPRYISTMQDRIYSTWFTPEWQCIEVAYNNRARSPDKIQAPANLESALEIARDLSADFDYVRVDLYVTPEDIFFGELTFTPNAGRGKFEPDAYDYEVGAWWRISEASSAEA